MHLSFQGLLLLVFITDTAIAQQGLTVSIVTDPPSEPYPAATWIVFSCHVTGNTSTVIYDWFYLCSQQDPPLVVVTYENRTNVNQPDVQLRSTPDVCLDMMMCNATDMSGNSGSATWRIGRVTEAGFWGTSTFLYNMSVLKADTDGDIGTIYCHSSSTNPTVGRWTSPHGLDITYNFTDPFSIQFNSGPGYFSYNTFELLNPLSQPFTTTHNGVYTCVVPDDMGIMQTLHIGIFSHQYTTPFSLILDQFGRVSESPITLNCPTTGLLPTLTLWRKSGADLSLVSGGIYEISEELRDRQTATFDNFLRIYQTHQQAEGIYTCTSISAVDGPVQVEINTTRFDYFIGMYTVGGSNSIDCTLEGVFIYTWMDEDGNTVADGNQLIYLVNDSIHHMTYTCSGLNLFELQVEYLYIKFVINVPNSALQVTATSDDLTPVLGQSYSMNCVGHKTLPNLVNLPSPQWYAQNGSVLQSVQLIGPRAVGLSSSELVAQFNTLRASHAGNYTCQASLSSPALTTPIVKIVTFGITIQLPSPTVSLAPLSSEPHTVGGVFSLRCQVTVSRHVDTPTSVDITWLRNGGSISASSPDARVAISDTTVTGGLTYQSTLTIRDLSISMDSNIGYSCQAIARSDPESSFILNSPSASSSVYTLQISMVTISVTVTPSQISVIDVPPHNSINLNCMATTPTTTSAMISFTWSKSALGSPSSTVLIHDGASVIIVTSGNTSALSTSESQSGGYVYNCSAAVGDSEPTFDTATVNVRGPTVPDAPTNLQSTVTSFSTATISWSITRVAYTPETYVVMYGTNPLDLNQRSPTISGVSGVAEYSVGLTGLQHGTLYYYQVQSTNTIGSTSSALSSVQIQNASVILSIATSNSVARAGTTYTLTCSAVELVDHSGNTAVTWKDGTGQPIMTGGDFVVTRQAMTQRVDYTLQFSPLRVQHTGPYTCEVAIQTVGYNESTRISVQVVPGNLRVSIQLNGTGHVGTPHQLLCQIDTAGSTVPYGSLTYQWTSTCSRECFILTQSTVASVSTQYIKAVDSGTHTCTVTDSVGNRGNTSVRISTTGVALYHSNDGLLANNSVVMASGGFLSGSFFCVSGRSQAGIGRWIAPNGDDYTLPGTHAFQVSVGGVGNPGVVEISVAGSDRRFPAGQWDGVYSCVIPDESGTEQVIYLGIYIVFGSPPLPVIHDQSLTASSQALYPHFTLNCSSSNSAATAVSWTEDNRALDLSQQVYETVQIVRDGTTSMYDNLLLILTNNVNDLSGRYGCSVGNSFGSSTATNTTFLGITVSEHGMFALGEGVSITCSSDFGVSSIDWRLGNQLVSTTPGSDGVLTIDAVDENDHGRQYTCRANAAFGIQERTVVINVEVDPDVALSVAIAPSMSSPNEGDSFTLTCTANKSLHLLNSPTINFYDDMGNRIVTSDGIRVGLTVESGSGMVMRTLTFESLDKSHSMEYRCNATITFAPPPYIISREAIWDLVVKTNDTTLPTMPTAPTTSPEELATGQGDQLSQSESFIYIGSGVGGGVAIVVIFVLIILIVLCCKRCRKRKQGYSIRCEGATPPSGLGMGTMDHHGTFYPGATNSMTPLTKFSEGPDPPPRKDFYVPQRSTLAMAQPNAYESYDAYICMNPVNATVYTPEAPPPQYDACSSFKFPEEKEKLYAEIPGEYLTCSNGESGGEVQYGNIDSSETKLQLQHTDSEGENA